jgi:hypothetical protein
MKLAFSTMTREITTRVLFYYEVFRRFDLFVGREVNERLGVVIGTSGAGTKFERLPGMLD